MATSTPVTRSFAYDNPNYVDHRACTLTAATAGSGGTSGKFYAYTNTVAYGFDLSITALGTSTYTVGGTATSSASQVSALWVTNTSTTGGVSLSTTTIGPFTVGGSGALQNAIGGYWRFTLQTASQTGGIALLPGDTIQFVNGTDATFTAVPILEWQTQFNGQAIA